MTGILDKGDRPEDHFVDRIGSPTDVMSTPVSSLTNMEAEEIFGLIGNSLDE